ncbi:hypothetical protein [Streptomyces rimosus]
MSITSDEPRSPRVDACIRYLTSKEPFLRYDHALATGVIEGACRRLTVD